MTEKRFAFVIDNEEHTFYDLGKNGEIMNMIDTEDMLNALYEENEQLKIRFKEERDTAMRLSRECDTLTIKKKKLELEIIRLETIIRTGDNDDYNRTS